MDNDADAAIRPRADGALPRRPSVDRREPGAYPPTGAATRRNGGVPGTVPRRVRRSIRCQLPVQVSAGVAVDPEDDPRNPNVVLAPGASVPL